MYRLAFLFFLTLALRGQAQEPPEPTGRDTFAFDFWGTTFWDYDDQIQQVREPLTNSLLAVRRHFLTGNVAEEYVRVQDTAWLFLAYDSLDPGRLISRGLYVAPPDYWIADTLVSFDPESYEEQIFLRYAPASFKHGPWIEEDSFGYVWQGEYAEGERIDLWERYNRRDPLYDLRGYIYEDDEIDRDTILNWALAPHHEDLVPELCAGEAPGQRGGLVEEDTPGGLWRLCSVVGETPTRTVWRLAHLENEAASCQAENWGCYLFLEDRTLIWGIPDRHGTTRETGHWEILEGNQLLFSLPKQGEKWFRLKYLRDGELVMEELKN